jgi:hypothetical protein
MLGPEFRFQYRVMNHVLELARAKSFLTANAFLYESEFLVESYRSSVRTKHPKRYAVEPKRGETKIKRQQGSFSSDAFAS